MKNLCVLLLLAVSLGSVGAYADNEIGSDGASAPDPLDQAACSAAATTAALELFKINNRGEELSEIRSSLQSNADSESGWGFDFDVQIVSKNTKGKNVQTTYRLGTIAGSNHSCQVIRLIPEKTVPSNAPTHADADPDACREIAERAAVAFCIINNGEAPASTEVQRVPNTDPVASVRVFTFDVLLLDRNDDVIQVSYQFVTVAGPGATRSCKITEFSMPGAG